MRTQESDEPPQKLLGTFVAAKSKRLRRSVPTLLFVVPVVSHGAEWNEKAILVPHEIFRLWGDACDVGRMAPYTWFDDNHNGRDSVRDDSRGQQMA